MHRIAHAVYFAIFLQFLRRLLRKVMLRPDTKFMQRDGDVLPDNYVAMTIFNPATKRYGISGPLCAVIFYCKEMDGKTTARIDTSVRQVFNKARVGFTSVADIREKNMCTLGTIDNFPDVLPDLMTTTKSRHDTFALLRNAIRDAIECDNFELA